MVQGALKLILKPIYARFADEMVILIDAHPRNDWLMRAVEKRLREELADLQVEINEAKSRTVDLGRVRASASSDSIFAVCALRGWVNYFAVGHASECFSFIRDWVEKKVRRHMGRA